MVSADTRGYGVSINKFIGRLSPKPLHWEYGLMLTVYAKMIRVKTSNVVFTTTSFKYNLNQAEKTFEFGGIDGTNVEVIGNFSGVNDTTSVAFAATVPGRRILMNPLSPYHLCLIPLLLSRRAPCVLQ